jgi:hydrolase, TatD family
MLIDSHCHLDLIDLAPYGGKFDAVLENARHSGVTHMLCVAIALERIPALLELAERYSQISVSVGVHPNERDGCEPDVDELVALADHPKVLAIGETGLDYFRTQGTLEWQQERFRIHVRAARRAHKPLIIHTRQASYDTLTILREEGASDVGGVMHCFTGDWEMARQAMELGFYISFSGIVTFRNAEYLKEIARRVPIDRLLVETDSPYLAPVPHRGKPNQPAYVRHVAEHIAELRGVSFEDIAVATSRNFTALFNYAGNR